VFGVLAGMCNEHTGPTLCAFMVGYAWWVHGKTQRRPTLAWSGAAGALVGFAAIFFAPGQDERYEGLAQRMGLVGRVVNRGVVGNLEILRDLLLAAAPLLAVLVILLIVAKDGGNERRAALRRALDLLALVIVAALVMAATIFASPKLGPRFFYVSMALLLAAVIAVIDAVATRRIVAVLVVVAAFASAYAAARSVPLYRRVARAGEARLAALAAAPPGSVFVADAFEQVDESWWFLGDDFRDAKKRELVAKYFGLAGVVFRKYDPSAPLGLTSVRIVPHYDLDPPGCLDEYGGLTLGSVKGFDLAGLHREAQIAIALLRSRLVGATLRSLDLEVTLSDGKLAAPKRVLMARWTPARFEGYVGRIERAGRSTLREIRLPAGIVGSDAEIYVLQVGGEARRVGTAHDAELRYAPWKPGVYWVLACRSDACFVVAATRHGA
jgi:hypothetical protein